MPAIWSSPRSWSVGELVSASLLNTHLRDNLEFLKAPPTALYTLNLSPAVSTAGFALIGIGTVWACFAAPRRFASTLKPWPIGASNSGRNRCPR